MVAILATLFPASSTWLDGVPGFYLSGPVVYGHTSRRFLTFLLLKKSNLSGECGVDPLYNVDQSTILFGARGCFRTRNNTFIFDKTLFSTFDIDFWVLALFFCIFFILTLFVFTSAAVHNSFML